MMQQQLFSVVILAGGLATRLHPITKTVPKSLLEINGIPFIVHQLNLLQKKGIKKVVLCISNLGEKIVEFLDNKKFDLDIRYSFDGPMLLGTAGAIKRALPLLDENFFVLYGDSYLECDYMSVQNAFINSQKLALMTLFFNDNQWDTSNVEYENFQIIAYDKKNKTERMKYIDYGLGVFNKAAFQYVSENNFCDLMVLYQSLLNENQLAGHEVNKRFYEIGSLNGIKELSSYLRTN